MQHIADTADIARAWALEGRTAVAVRAVGAEGLGPRSTGDVLLVDSHGRTAGTLLGGAADAAAVRAALDLVGSAAAPASAVTRVDVADRDATGAGLTCGGSVELLVQRLDAVPAVLWERIAAVEPSVLVTAMPRAGTRVRAPVAVLPGPELVGTLGDEALDALATSAGERALRVPGAAVGRHRSGEAELALELVVEAWNPVPRLLVVGSGELAGALVRQAALLGWEGGTVDGAEPATAAVASFTATDAVVVIDHDPAVATPVLARALERGVGYVGALGSRRTQASRREHLAADGLSSEQLDRLHGPTGLDIGARTPAESAVSIVAEVIASRSGRSGAPLGQASGRISG